MKIRRMIFVIVLAFLFHAPVFGENQDINAEILREMKEMREIIRIQGEKIQSLEMELKSQKQSIDKQEQKTMQEIKRIKEEDVSEKMKRKQLNLKELAGGFEIGAGITFVGQGTRNANNVSDGASSRFDATWSAEIDIAKTFDDLGLAYILMETGQGRGLEDKLSVFSNVNYDAKHSQDARVMINEAWYEHYFFNRQFTVTAGKIDATNYIDTNAFANDGKTQFLGRMFVNSAVIGWSENNALGLRAYIAPERIDFTSLEFVYMDARGEWDNVFDDPFVAGQINFMPAKAFNYDEGMWGGNYRAFVWYNGMVRESPRDSDILKRGNVGFGFSADQRLTDVYGVFGRFSWTDPERNDFVLDWSCGAEMTGKHWDREHDIAAIAIGQVVPGRPYKDSNEHNKPETHIETYYSFKVNDNLAVSPGLQMIWDANGGGTDLGKKNAAIFIYGIRGHVDF